MTGAPIGILLKLCPNVLKELLNKLLEDFADLTSRLHNKSTRIHRLSRRSRLSREVPTQSEILNNSDIQPIQKVPAIVASNTLFRNFANKDANALIELAKYLRGRKTGKELN